VNWFREFTLGDGRKKRIKVEEWRTFQNELRELGITEQDIFQMQLIKVEPPKNNKQTRRGQSLIEQLSFFVGI